MDVWENSPFSIFLLQSKAWRSAKEAESHVWYLHSSTKRAVTIDPKRRQSLSQYQNGQFNASVSIPPRSSWSGKEHLLLQNRPDIQPDVDEPRKRSQLPFQEWIWLWGLSLCSVFGVLEPDIVALESITAWSPLKIRQMAFVSRQVDIGPILYGGPPPQEDAITFC